MSIPGAIWSISLIWATVNFRPFKLLVPIVVSVSALPRLALTTALKLSTQSTTPNQVKISPQRKKDGRESSRRSKPTSQRRLRSQRRSTKSLKQRVPFMAWWSTLAEQTIKLRWISPRKRFAIFSTSTCLRPNTRCYCPGNADMSQVFGAFYCARAAARAFIKLNIKGAVVFTASMASYRPNKVSIM